MKLAIATEAATDRNTSRPKEKVEKAARDAAKAKEAREAQEGCSRPLPLCPPCRAVSVRCHLSVAWPHESVIAASLCAMMYTAHRPSSRGERAAATGTAETRPRSKKRMRHKVPGCLRRHVNDPESQFYLHGSSHRAWLIGVYLGTPVPNTTQIGTLPRALLRARSTSTGRAPVTSSWPGAYRKPQPSPTGL